MKEYMRILGCRVRDRVTDYVGIATSVSFDLYGCVQVVVAAPGVDKDGKVYGGHWFDYKRLVVIDSKPVMEVPSFEHVPGGQELPNQDPYRPYKG